AGMVRRDGERLALGPLGDDLLDDDHRREGFDGPDGDLLAALVDLGPALRSGATPWAQRTGCSLWQTITGDPAEYAEQVEESGVVAQMLPGLEHHPLWQRADTVTVTGPASGHLVATLARAEPAPRVTVAAPPGLRGVAQQNLPSSTTVVDVP